MKSLFAFLIATAAWAGDRPFLAPFEIAGEPATHGRIDQLVFDDWPSGVPSSKIARRYHSPSHPARSTR